MEDNLSLFTSKIKDAFALSPLFYISNDPERALGLEELIPNFHIVHIDSSQYLDDFKTKNIQYFCWQEHLSPETNVFRSSYRLLSSREFQEYFNANKKDKNYIQTFKISPAFEKKVAELGAILLNTTAAKNRLFENKLSQFQELSKLPISLPLGGVYNLSGIEHDKLVRELGSKYVIQFDRGHTGSGTVFVDSPSALLQLKEKFPERWVKASEYVVGVAYTLNGVVGSNGIYLGGLSRQITGDQVLTPLTGATIGNDFGYRTELKTGHQKIEQEAVIIGNAMLEKGYRGLFGLDLIVLADGSHKFIEINARQPASIPMFTKMQLMAGQVPLTMIHLAEFLGLPYNLNQESYNAQALQPMNYAQVFVRAFHEYQLQFPVRSGVYRLQGDNAAIDRPTAVVKPDTIFLDEERDKALLFQKDGYSITDLDEGGFLILTPAKGRQIKINEELGRIQLKGSAFLPDGQLLSWIRDSLTAIKHYQR